MLLLFTITVVLLVITPNTTF